MNFKSQLHELIQKKKLPTPTYTLMDQKGPSHDTSFRCHVECKGLLEVPVEGEWRKTIKSAESSAAEAVFEQFGELLYSDSGSSSGGGVKELIDGVESASIGAQSNWKGFLFEYCQKMQIELPRLRTDMQGAANFPHFITTVTVNGKDIVGQEKYTKKKAEQSACEEAVHIIMKKKKIDI